MSRATALMRSASSSRSPPASRSARWSSNWRLRWSRRDAITAADFTPAFLVVAAISASSALLFSRLPADAGAEMSGPEAAKAGGTDRGRRNLRIRNWGDYIRSPGAEQCGLERGSSPRRISRNNQTAIFSSLDARNAIFFSP